MKVRTFKRYEKKYLITEDKLDDFLVGIRKYMDPDAYCSDGEKYKVYNVYFDDEQSSIIRHSLSKPYYKEKLRLRGYEPFDNPDKTVFLELKKKIGGIVSKRRATMTLDEARLLIRQMERPDTDKYIDRQVIDEILFFLKQNTVKPAAYICYDRLAFFGRDDADFRLTVDSEIKAGAEDFFSDEACPYISLLKDGHYIMEIKILGSIPLWLARLMSELGIRKVSFSKYGRFYETAAKLKREQCGKNDTVFSSAMMERKNNYV